MSKSMVNRASDDVMSIDITNKCLCTVSGTDESGSTTNFYLMPVYENSFYFYFGLKDGNTAIDRLYTEYFSECVSDTKDVEEGNIMMGKRMTNFTEVK